MKLKKWVENTLQFIMMGAMCLFMCVEDFEICAESFLFFGLLISIILFCIIILAKYGRNYDDDDDE